MAYKQELWDEAKRKCRLGEDEIRMAKEMGLNPKSLIRNISSHYNFLLLYVIGQSDTEIE